MPQTISIVIPVYNEEKNISLVAEEIANVFLNLPFEYEIIFVNDGSSDESFSAIADLAHRHANIRGIDFSRNFGKETATSAGCHVAVGDAIVTMDADLQHPASLIPDFIQHWQSGAEVVYTVRKKNEGASLTKRWTSALFYWIFNRVSEFQSEPRSTDFRLMDKKVIRAFRQFPERERMFRGMIDWMGFQRVKVEFSARERQHGRASYSYAKLLKLAINSFTSFSLLPLRFAGYLGVFITVVSGLLLVIMLANRWFFNPDLFTPIAILATGNTFLIGIVLVSLGFIALYIARIHNEVIGRPLYIVRESVNVKDETGVHFL